jgi:hypothetical protein
LSSVPNCLIEKRTGWPKDWEKLPNFLKSSQNSCQTKKCQISTSKFDSKAQNILIKPLLKLKNGKLCLENAYLGENVKTCFSNK